MEYSFAKSIITKQHVIFCFSAGMNKEISESQPALEA